MRGENICKYIQSSAGIRLMLKSHVLTKIVDFCTYTREKFITYDYVVNSIVLENLRSSNFVISQIKRTKFLFHKGTITIDWFWFNFLQMDITFKYKIIKKSGLSWWKWVVLCYESLVPIVRNEFLAGVQWCALVLEFTPFLVLNSPNTQCCFTT